MKQPAHKLLPQTVIRTPEGKIGTLLKFGASANSGKFGWSVQFAGERLARFVTCDKAQGFEIV